MKMVADTLGVARSNLHDRVQRPPKPRGPYWKPEDVELRPAIRQIVDDRPSYDYRRITAVLNRQLRTKGAPIVNAKRVLRILQANGLTLERHTGRRPGRTHDGVVVALKSNVRWCSDHFELAGRDGSVVRVLFAIDACDREIIAWSATTAGISGEMVRDLMVVCVERRFGATRAPTPVEWLSERQRLHRCPDQRYGDRSGSAARLHAGPLAREQRHQRSLREDAQAGLCTQYHSAERRYHHQASARLVRGLQ